MELFSIRIQRTFQLVSTKKDNVALEKIAEYTNLPMQIIKEL